LINYIFPGMMDLCNKARALISCPGWFLIQESQCNYVGRCSRHALLRQNGFSYLFLDNAKGFIAMTMFEKLNQLLADGQWHSTAELVEQVGHRFSATMHRAVKKCGWQMEKRRADSKTFEYRLIVQQPSVK
jgi:hypothetical protein